MLHLKVVRRAIREPHNYIIPPFNPIPLELHGRDVRVGLEHLDNFFQADIPFIPKWISFAGAWVHRTSEHDRVDRSSKVR